MVLLSSAKDLAAKAVIALFLLLGSLGPGNLSFAQSQQVTGATVNLQVQNSFSLSETVAGDVGINVVLTDIVGADTSTITLTPAGVLTISAPNDSEIIVVDDSGATPGQFSISGAAPNTNMVITFFNLVDLTCAACGGGNPAILLSGMNHDAGGAPMTDGNGDLTFNYGFTLTTVPGPPQYEDGLYSGGFDMSVSY